MTSSTLPLAPTTSVVGPGENAETCLDVDLTERPAMQDPIRPEHTAVTAAQNLLKPHLHDADVYWQTLVLLYTNAVEDADAQHSDSCTDSECTTCALIRDLNAVAAAHDLIQPAGCACPDHITYPMTPTRVAGTPNATATAR